ncbi:MAG TPA: hypothetical protein VFR63_13805 [Gaiellaceae bacterium]|nr:hypothetical protein [Gaiellaceae bacterium]
MTRPFVRAYRYRLRPGAAEGCLTAWARGQEIDAPHVPMTSLHYRSAEDPAAWLEPTVLPDEESCRRGVELVQADPDHDAVWREVEAALAEPRVESESDKEVARFP